MEGHPKHSKFQRKYITGTPNKHKLMKKNMCFHLFVVLSKGWECIVLLCVDAFIYI